MSITLTLLGTGTSAGIPMVGCDCEVCRSPDPRDHRDRSGAMVQYPDPNGAERVVLIDTPPELRHQLVRHRVMRCDGVVYTHNHADHIFGLDDLRRFNAVMGTAVDIFAEQRMMSWLHTTFGYIFQPQKNVNRSFIPMLITHPITEGSSFQLHGREWLPMRLMHGRLPVLGFRVGRMAYCTDVSSIPPETYPMLEDLDVLVLDALRYRHHPTHLTVDQALEVVDEIKPRRTYFTHIAHDIRHAELEAHLPEHVFVGYDGLTIEIDD